VRTSGGQVVLAGDACSLRRSLNQMILPGHAHDLELYRQSLAWFEGQRRAGRTIAFGHDPGFWSTVPPSPRRDPAP
jgi:hypothetical protein